MGRGDVENGSSQHRIIRPANRLQVKMRLSDLTVSELMAKANQVMAAMAKSYPKWLQADLEDLAAAYRKLCEVPQDQAVKAELFRISHDIKGQAAGFGYDLAGEVGGSLCYCLNRRETISEVDLQVIEAHIDAFTACVKQSLKGDGGTIGRELSAELSALIERT
ncbi:MAG: Hpt domain-containing protein [Alphaproteobacteria bacterium]|jgi:chemotaxis protein histidine kinase CheA|nr:Hpt domain-containing protein [Alphaproteobacteria bacterium]